MDGNQKKAGALSPLHDLAAQARMLSQQIALSGIQLGRVLCEAKKLVAHGAWTSWLEENAPIGERAAQNLMAVWRRFGNGAYSEIETSKLVRLLALPTGEEDAFFEKNDVNGMTAREVTRAVRGAKDENAAREKTTDEGAAQDKATKGAPPDAGVPEAIIEKLRAAEVDRDRYRGEMERVAGLGKEAIAAANQLRTEVSRLTRDVADKDMLLEEAQAAVEDAQERLSTMESREARGDADRAVTGELSAQEFATAVRTFLSQTLVLPHMGATLARLEGGDWATFDANLKMIEEWATQARRAVESVAGEMVEV